MLAVRPISLTRCIQMQQCVKVKPNQSLPWYGVWHKVKHYGYNEWISMLMEEWGVTRFLEFGWMLFANVPSCQYLSLPICFLYAAVRLRRLNQGLFGWWGASAFCFFSGPFLLKRRPAARLQGRLVSWGYRVRINQLQLSLWIRIALTAFAY